MVSVVREHVLKCKILMKTSVTPVIHMTKLTELWVVPSDSPFSGMVGKRFKVSTRTYSTFFAHRGIRLSDRGAILA